MIEQVRGVSMKQACHQLTSIYGKMRIVDNWPDVVGVLVPRAEIRASRRIVH